MKFENRGGADFLIVQAIEAGHHQVPDIAEFARLEPLVARAALNRMRTEGQLRRYGNTRFARYVLVRRRRSSK